MRFLAAFGVMALALVARPAIADDAPLFPLEWNKEWDKLLLRDLEPHWVRAWPRLSLVARDWGGTQPLLGHLSLTDQARLSHSSRMLVTRLGFADGQFVPFAQVGAGQWRIDKDLVANLPRDVEMAGQVGGGVEWTLLPTVSVAFEADYTVLYRQQHEPQMVCAPQVAATLLAARGQF